jgi:integrase
MRIRYNLKKPGGGRRSFSIMKDVVDGDERTQTKVQDSRIDAINRLVDRGLKDVTTAGIELKNIIEEMYQRDEKLRGKDVYSQANLKVLNEYWRKEYEERDLVSPKDAYDRLMAPLRAIGPLSLASASRKDLERALSNFCQGNARRQRRYASALNQLLRYLKRDDTIRLMKDVAAPINHISEADLVRVAKNLDDKLLSLLVRVAFGTGARLGEVVAMRGPVGKSLFIASQVDRGGDYRETKTRKSRHAYILPGFEKDVADWVKVPPEDRARFQTEHITAYLAVTRLCEKLFDDPVKHCSIHDLRHSYAIHLVQRGVSLALVAQSLGNSVAVCEKYYSGFVLRPEGIDLIERTLKG